MDHKYWEWEAQPLKEKLKTPSIKPLTDVLFGDDETQAYRFAKAMTFLRKRGVARLKDFPNDLPKATWFRYLEYAVQIGFIEKSGDGVYSMTNRFTNSLKNFAEYYDKWRKDDKDEEIDYLYPRARKKGADAVADSAKLDPP